MAVYVSTVDIFQEDPYSSSLWSGSICSAKHEYDRHRSNVQMEVPRCFEKMIPGVALALVLTGCANGFSGWQVVRAASEQSSSTNPKRVFANCPSGKKVLGGGAVVGYQQGNSFPADPNGIIYESEPTGDNNGWQASAIDRTPGDDWAVIAYAICASIGQ